MKYNYESFFSDRFVNNAHREKLFNDILMNKTMEVFHKKLPSLGLDEREGQQDMAFDIMEETIGGRKHLLVEAGVGIGKSFAYLIPLFLYFQRRLQTTIIISTSTISLQEQLYNDINDLSKLMHHRVDVVLAKGMNHFICRKRLYRKRLTKYNKLFKKYFKDNKFDKKDYPPDFVDRYWNEVCVSKCEFLNCEYYESCGFVDMRNRMKNIKGFILCNHDLLIVNSNKRLNRQKTLMANAEFVVIDEAHNLEEKARTALKEEWSYYKINNLINNSKKILNKRSGCLNLLYKLDGIIRNIFILINNQVIEETDKNINVNFDSGRFHIIITDKMKNMIEEVSKIVNGLYKDLQLVEVHRNQEDIQDELIEGYEDFRRFLRSITLENSDKIFWIEALSNNKKYNSLVINSCLKNLDEILRQMFFDTIKFTTILTSATLTSQSNGAEEERYRYFMESVGFELSNDTFLSEPKQSPFNYDENTILYCPNDMPHPTASHKEFISKSLDKIIDLLKITDGKALILFTAKDDLNEVYKGLNEKELPWDIIRQSANSSQVETLNNFKFNVKSVLLGTGIMWEGINVPGNTLSNLIIVRLPFPVPDPILEYKASKVRSPLMEVYLPEMILKLRQGIGRLIRGFEDKGIISILDSRLSDKSRVEYRDTVLEVLNIKNRTSNIEDIEKFAGKLKI
jgi:ATP-dependent DNA helicase DinG